MKRICFLAAAAFVYAQSNPRVDQVFERWDKPSSPGCALAVMQGGRIVYQHGYGLADLDHDLPITPDSVFHVASVSKQFTAASIVLLAQKGKLSFDDPVRKYIPELPDFGHPLTIRHLLHHTSGVRDQWNLLILSGWRLGRDLVRDDDVLNLVSRMKELNFAPGEMHLYSNTGYTLLAQIVKRVSGVSLREFTTKEIFQPLGMNNTHFRDAHAEIVKNMAGGYENGTAGFEHAVPNFDTVGASSLLTTVRDMALWDENFFSPRVGGAQMIESMMTTFKLTSGTVIPYRFGQTSGTYRGLTFVEHSGGDSGYRSHYIRFPDQHFSVVCLCNISANPGALARQVTDVLLADKLAPPEHRDPGPAMTLTSEQLAARAGVYWNAADHQVDRWVVKDSKLVIESFGNTDLVPVTETRFRNAAGNLDIVFTGDGYDATPSGAPSQHYTRMTPVNLDARHLTEFAADYYSSEIDSTYRIDMKDGSLMLHRKKELQYKLDPQFKDVFRAPGLGFIRFERDQTGRLTGFRLSDGRVKKLLFVVR